METTVGLDKGMPELRAEHTADEGERDSTLRTPRVPLHIDRDAVSRVQ